MRLQKHTISFSIAIGLLLVTASVPMGLAQQSMPNTPRQNPTAAPGVRNVVSGQKLKMKGRIIRRDADTFSIRDQGDMETIVRLTDQTSVKSNGGFFHRGKNYDVTSLLRGLHVEVEGRGDQQGQLVADKIRFDTSDLRTAQTVESRVGPVEQETQRIAGQMDELTEVAKAAREDAGRANERISSLDDYDVQDAATVYFPVNSSVIPSQYRQTLDQLAQKAASAKGYVIEITGHADSTGNADRNRVLSQQRADAVVRYLQENHDIPLRRIVTPFGYGALKPVANNGTPDGRRQNRRVEVKILVSKGITSRS
jgi:outer membrane protein OmpA-like peptidoglycan-associated protein